MSSIHTGIVTDIEVRPYDAEKDETNNPNSDKFYSPYNHKRILENLKEIKEVLVLHIQPDGGSFSEVERITDLGITSSWFYALNCLSASLYDPSVLFSSISVECVLNHDVRLESERLRSRPHEWLDLNMANLRLANNLGLPTDLLLNSGETLQDTIEFVYRRNKVAHGDIEGYRRKYPGGFTMMGFTESGFTIPQPRPSKEHAIEQLDKAKKFIVEWSNHKPRVRMH